MSSNLNSNRAKASAAWSPDCPPWVLLLADACDRTSQRIVADKLARSGGYVSRLINRSYAGSYEEAEQLVRAAYGAEGVMCPLYGEMPLRACIRHRRRKTPAANEMQVRLARACPDCPNNTDRNEED